MISLLNKSLSNNLKFFKLMSRNWKRKLTNDTINALHTWLELFWTGVCKGLLGFSFSSSGLDSGFAVTHSCAPWKCIPKIPTSLRPQLAFILFFSSQYLCYFPLQTAQRRPLRAWNETVFLCTRPSVTTGWGGGVGHTGHHRSIQGFHSECLPGMMPLKRSPWCEIMFL